MGSITNEQITELYSMLKEHYKYMENNAAKFGVYSKAMQYQSKAEAIDHFLLMINNLEKKNSTSDTKDCTCKRCGIQYSSKQLIRSLGEFSTPVLLGYCSASCFTLATANKTK